MNEFTLPSGKTVSAKEVSTRALEEICTSAIGSSMSTIEPGEWYRIDGRSAGFCGVSGEYAQVLTAEIRVNDDGTVDALAGNLIAK